jgi:ribonuclease Z
VTAPRFDFLGTSAAVASATRDNTSIVVQADDRALLVDCGGSVVHRLRRLGMDPLLLTHVIVTHLHVDHAYGLPSLVRQLGLLGWRAPLGVVCRPEHIEPLQTLLEVFGLWRRPDFFPVALVPIDLEVGARGPVAGAFVVRTATNEHGAMPNFAVRIEVGPRALVYSSETRPSEAVVSLARSRRHARARGDVRGERPPARAAGHPLQCGRRRAGGRRGRRRPADPHSRRR